jgi:hypothetical protein
MSLFIPFGFYKQPFVAGGEGWTPADFSNIEAWWIADSGVVMSTVDSSKVQRWEDQINGYEVTQSFDSNVNLNAEDRSPTTSSAWADLNNQPIIRFGMTTNASFTNAPQYMYTTGSFTPLSSQSYTQIIICEYIGRNASQSFSSPLIGMSDNTSVKRFWFDRQLSDGDMRVVTGLGAPSLQTVDTNKIITLGSERVLWSQYQAATGDTYYGNNTTTGSLAYNGATTNDTWAATTLFSINGNLIGTTNIGSLQFLRANDMAVAEVILIYGQPSASEWVEFKNYVFTKYNISIS